MSKLVVEEISGSQALTALRSEWRALFEEANTSPFLSWEWITAWHKWLGQEKTPRLLCARDSGRLVGLLPLGEEEQRLKGTPLRVRRISFLGEQLGGSDYLDVLALTGYEQECANVLFGHVAQNLEFDLLELDGIASDSPSLPWLTWRFGSNPKFRCHLEARYVCPQVRLDSSWEELLQRTHRASYFTRCVRRLRKLPGFDYTIVTDPDRAEEAFERFLVLHELSWSNRGGSGATGLQVLKSFQRDVIMELARAGRLRFEEIWIDGACRASLYGIDAGARYCFYLKGYDPAWAKYSLGYTLIGLSIASAVERGVKVYDMLRGAEPYKFDWANETRATISVQIAGNSLPAGMAVARDRAADAARATAYTFLPEPALALWRRWRKRPKPQPMPDTDSKGQPANAATDDDEAVEMATTI